MDLQAISDAASKSAPLEATFVKGRVLQYDADFGCYECAWLDESIESNIRALKGHIEVKRKMAGAEFVNVHITLGMKGGRDQIATVKPYQEQRTGRNVEVKERVAILRNFLASYNTETVTSVVNLLQEADDSLTQYQVKQIAEHGIESSVIMSGDKDLWMSEGWHCDQKTGEFYLVEGYGKTDYKDVGNVKPKLIGRGTSWFWHQLIMGDSADNIAGLPQLSGKLMNRYLPTKTKNPNRKPASAGEAKAVAILKGVTTDAEAARRVHEAYKHHYPKNATEMLVEQAFLLWMRRTGAVDDVITFLNECGISCGFSLAQKERLKEFKRLAIIQIKASED